MVPPDPQLIDRTLTVLHGLNTRQGEGTDDLHHHLDRVEDAIRLLHDLVHNAPAPQMTMPGSTVVSRSTVPMTTYELPETPINSHDLRSTLVPLKL
jgi:hypothetical protein